MIEKTAVFQQPSNTPSLQYSMIDRPSLWLPILRADESGLSKKPKETAPHNTMANQ